MQNLKKFNKTTYFYTIPGVHFKYIRFLILLILLFSVKSYSQSLEYKNKIFFAIYASETNYGKDTIQRSDKDSLSIGPMQIQPIMVQEINNISGKHFTLADRYDYWKCVEMFFTYQNYINPTWDYEIAARCWNGGRSGMRKKSTKHYWALVQQKLKVNQNNVPARNTTKLN